MPCEICMPWCVGIKHSLENEGQVALPVVCLNHLYLYFLCFCLWSEHVRGVRGPHLQCRCTSKGAIESCSWGMWWNNLLMYSHVLFALGSRPVCVHELFCYGRVYSTFEGPHNQPLSDGRRKNSVKSTSMLITAE